MPTSEHLGALGAVHQGFGDLPCPCHSPDARQQFHRPGDKGVVEGDSHPLAGLDEVEHPLVASVPVGPEQQALDADLDPFRFPGPLGNIGGLAMLVVHWNDHAAPPFQQVDAGDGAQRIVGKRHGTGVNGLARLVVFVRRNGQRSRRPVHPAVLETALDSIYAVLEFSLHPFQVGQAGAVGVLVEHPRRDQFGESVDGFLNLPAG